MNLSILFFIVAASAKVQYSGVDPPIVQTSFGPIQGKSYTTFSGKKVNVFLGVPYAEPLSQETRFEKARLPDSWADGRTILADQWGDACHVHHRGAQKKLTYSEDCLVMNIITPKKTKKTFPILVYIHGGGFEIGNIKDIGYEHLAENFVTQNVIVVTIQYRLGFLGFITNGESSLPGNLGLWDQALALEFIHKALPSFGGDVKKITLMGNSAGAASVTSLMASPHSNKLFLQAIQLSGTIFCPWAYGENVIEVSSKLSKAVGCDFKNSSTLKECLKKKSVDELFDGMQIVGLDRHHPEFMLFHPHLDSDFFSEPVELLLAKAPKKKTIQGLTNDESGIFTRLLDIPIGGFYIPPEKRGTFSRSDLKTFIESISSDLGSDGPKIVELATEFYGNTTNDDDHAFFLQAYTDILSDLQFNVPVFQEIEIKRKHGWKTYSYLITHSRNGPVLNPDAGLKGAIHGEELPFLIEYNGLEKTLFREEDKEFKRILLESIISFIKTGTPTASKGSWKPITDKDPGIHFILSDKPVVEKKAFHEDANRLWLETIPSKVNKTTLKNKLLPGLELDEAARSEMLRSSSLGYFLLEFSVYLLVLYHF